MTSGRLCDLFEQRNEVAERGDLAIGQQNQRILHDRFHGLGAGDEIRRDEAAIELHPFDDFKGRLGRLRFLDRDHALASDLVHRLRHQFADRRIVVR